MATFNYQEPFFGRFPTHFIKCFKIRAYSSDGFGRLNLRTTQKQDQSPAALNPSAKRPWTSKHPGDTKGAAHQEMKGAGPGPLSEVLQKLRRPV